MKAGLLRRALPHGKMTSPTVALMGAWMAHALLRLHKCFVPSGNDHRSDTCLVGRTGFHTTGIATFMEIQVNPRSD